MRPDDAHVHVMPSDLERAKSSETYFTAFSLPVGNPDEDTVPCYTEEQVKALATDFFYWWSNAPGTNTYQGFDEWVRQGCPKPGSLLKSAEG